MVIMAVFTKVSLADAEQLVFAHGLNGADRIRPIAAGSVNSNYFVDCPERTIFLRIYEDSDVSGVAYEWKLLDHLVRSGVAIPKRLEGVKRIEPGEYRIEGKPTALFEVVPGEMICQAGVTDEHCRELGEHLAGVHRASSGFNESRAGRFTHDMVIKCLGGIARTPDLVDTLNQLQDRAEWVRTSTSGDSDTLPSGVIHGDLFRDNVLWQGTKLSGMIDWESASEGIFTFDLMVVFLAWCFGDSFDYGLGKALLKGYQSVRPLEPNEKLALRRQAISVATRFAVTRITDFHLRESMGGGATKDYRRFVQRLDELCLLSDEEFARTIL
jgi:homoserine kinase type II